MLNLRKRIKTQLRLTRTKLIWKTRKITKSKTGKSVLVILLSQILIWFIFRESLEKPITIQDAVKFQTNPFIDQTFLPLVEEVEYPELIGVTLAENIDNANNFELKLQKLLSEEYDPRLMPALLMNLIRQNLESFGIDEKFKVPFSWSSWLDLESSFTNNNLSCEQLNLEILDLESCSDINNSPKVFPLFRITGKILGELTEEKRRLIGSNYLLHSAPIPERIVIMGIGPTLVIPTFKNTHASVYHKYDRDYMRSMVTNRTINIQEEASKLRTCKHLQGKHPDDLDINRDIFRAVSAPPVDTHLKSEDFILNINLYVEALSENVVYSVQNQVLNVFDRKLLLGLQFNLKYNDIYPKYFHEALTIEDKRGHHYDWRFFQKLSYSDYEKAAILHRLTRAWLRFSNSIGLKTWLAHGSLLGWYWNGITMPWDPDLDVQMTIHSLLLLARNYNQTLVVDAEEGIGSYLLDIGPSYFSRHKANGLNAIDARFIDTASGFYVDITALAFSDRSSQDISEWDIPEVLEFNKVLDKDYKQKEQSKTLLPEELSQILDSKRENIVKEKQLFNCKNRHFYTLQDLHPLEPTFFEGYFALVPHNYLEILNREYPHGLYSNEHAGHKYRPMLDLWVPKAICPKDKLGNKCKDETTLLEANLVRAMTSRHRKQMKLAGKPQFGFNWEMPNLPLSRLDPWIIRRAIKLGSLFV